MDDDQIRAALSALTMRLDHIESQLARGSDAGYVSWADATARRLGPVAGASPEVVTLIQSGRRIEAIKRYADLTGSGLRESKLAVEAIESALASGGQHGLG
jgi:ribosomal protein L7/L12